ncbi:MAG: HNH endonuclease, partial [Candidatus Aenigmarchaeota archaeon]|nr:HNH endonuclease [Candidatus Aenigmarchaeota archaeon]
MGKYHCINCDIEIDRQRKRCKKCDILWRKKRYRNEGNPNWKNGITKTVSNCKACGKRFQYYPNSRIGKYCSNKCRNVGRMKRITKICLQCGKEFETHKCYDKRVKCCSKKCGHAYRCETNPLSPSTQRNITLIVLNCAFCKNDFEVPKKESYKKYCSRKCYGDHRKILSCGENNPAWRGGTVTYRGSDWFRKRRECRKRDNFRCRRCEEYNTKLDVHHIIPYKKVRRNDLENLILLCCRCHKRVESNYEKYGMTNYIRKMLEENRKLGLEKAVSNGRIVVKV